MGALPEAKEPQSSPPHPRKEGQRGLGSTEGLEPRVPGPAKLAEPRGNPGEVSHREPQGNQESNSSQERPQKAGQGGKFESFEKYSRSRRGRGCSAGVARRLRSPRFAPAVWPRLCGSRPRHSPESRAAPRPKLVVPAPARRPWPAGALSGRGRAGLPGAAAAGLRAAGALRFLGNLGFTVLLFPSSELFIPRSPRVPPSFVSPSLLPPPRVSSFGLLLSHPLSLALLFDSPPVKKRSQLKAAQFARPQPLSNFLASPRTN